MTAADPAAGTVANTAVVLTPPGVAAIAVIRLIGPANSLFIERHLSKPLRPMRCVHCDLIDAGETIDDVVAVLTDAGHIDLNLHGGTWVVQATLQLAERLGYRVTPWLESAEAIDAGDEIERQMLIDLPRAKSKTILRLLTGQPAAWAAMLAANDPDAMRNAIADRSLATALTTPAVAIVGPPNVGKSTLANALFAREHSITADRPGTTRDWVGELADLDGLVVRLIDTPGVRETSDLIEAAAIGRAGGVIAAADCVIVALDGSRPLDDAERQVLDSMRDRRPVVVRTKADRPTRCDVGEGMIDVCAIDARGLPELRAAVWRRLGVSDLYSPTARCWTESQRYKLHALLESASAS